VVKERVVDQGPTISITAALELDQAMMRRRLAAELGGVLTFESHEKIRRRFMASLSDEVPDPRYAKPTLEQIQKADVWIFKRLARETRAGIRPTAAGTLPLVEAMDAVLATQELAMILMPLPEVHPRAAKREAVEDTGGEAKPLSKRQKKKAAAKAKAQAGHPARHEGGSSGKGAGKGKSEGSGSMPKGLLGLRGTRGDGERLCYGWNLGTCSAAAGGAKCDRGWHECMKCGATGHGAHQCGGGRASK
jgi:hypothetical protein